MGRRDLVYSRGVSAGEPSTITGPVPVRREGGLSMVKKKNQLASVLAGILLILVVLGVVAYLAAGLFW